MAHSRVPRPIRASTAPHPARSRIRRLVTVAGHGFAGLGFAGLGFACLWVAGLGAALLTGACGGAPAGSDAPVQPLRLEFASQPEAYVAGESLSLEVRLIDGAGEIVPEHAVLIELLPAGGLAGLMGGHTALTLGGVAVFSSLRIEAAGGGYQVEARAPGYESVTSEAFEVAPGPVTRLRLTSVQDPVLRTQPLSLTAAAQDAFGNAVPAYAGTVGLTVLDPEASLPPPHMFVPADLGEHDFEVVFRAMGAQTILAADLDDPDVQGSLGVFVRNIAVINEVVYDDEGPDGEDVFIELRGQPGESLDGHHLVGINGSNGSVYAVIPLAGTIPGDGYYVVATSDANPDLTAIADLVSDEADLQNGPDELALYLDHGGIDALELDALAYGVTSAYAGAGEGDPAPLATGGEALARTPDGSDTNDNASDFMVTSTPTPGAPNG